MAGLRASFANKYLDPATSLGELEPQLVVAVEGKRSLVEEAIREEAPGVCRDIEAVRILGNGPAGVAQAARELDLQDLPAVDADQTRPFDREGAGGIRLEAQLAAIEALDLAGQPVAVMENHDIGLRRTGRGGRGQDEDEQQAAAARPKRSPARPCDRRRAIHGRVPL